MNDAHDLILATVGAAIQSLKIVGKTGKSLLQPSIARELQARNLVADQEDTRGFMAPGMCAWRSKDTGLPEPTTSRRRIDIVVYSGSDPVALIETESDLDDLRPPGTINRRDGHYDVHSLASTRSATHFESYKSLERMAAAAFYWSLAKPTGRYPTAEAGVSAIQKIASDRPSDHNPGGLLLILVSGRCRPKDRSILSPRLASLGAHLICAS